MLLTFVICEMSAQGASNVAGAISDSASVVGDSAVTQQSELEFTLKVEKEMLKSKKPNKLPAAFDTTYKRFTTDEMYLYC